MSANVNYPVLITAYYTRNYPVLITTYYIPPQKYVVILRLLINITDYIPQKQGSRGYRPLPTFFGGM